MLTVLLPHLTISRCLARPRSVDVAWSGLIRSQRQAAAFLARLLSRIVFFFFSSRRRHTRFKCDWSSDVCSSDLFVVAHQPIDTLDHTSILGDQHRGWEPNQPSKLVSGCVVAQYDWIIHGLSRPVDLDSLFSNERSDRAFAFLIHGHAQHGEPARSVLVLELHEPRNLDLARSAPRGPEIHQNNLAFELAEGNVAVIQVLQGKVWGGWQLVPLIRICGARRGKARGALPEEREGYNSYK